jgi:hypothetical protein
VWVLLATAAMQSRLAQKGMDVQKAEGRAVEVVCRRAGMDARAQVSAMGTHAQRCHYEECATCECPDDAKCLTLCEEENGGRCPCSPGIQTVDGSIMFEAPRLEVWPLAICFKS